MRRYQALLRNRPFARVWFGSTVNAMGDAMTWVAMLWLVAERTGSAAAVSLLVVTATAPVAVGGILMGAALDRFRRTRFLMLVNAALGAAVLSIPLAAWLGDGPSIPHLFAVAATYGLLKMANWAGVPSIVPTLVSDGDLSTANAMESVSFGLADIAGPAVAGALLATVGAVWVLATDGLTYVLFFLALASLPAAAGGERRSGVGGLGLREALGSLRRDRPVWITTLMFMCAAAGEGMLAVLVPVYVRNDLHAGPGTFGLFLASFALAGTLGAVVVGAIEWRRPLARSIAACQTIAGLAFVPLLLLPPPPVFVGTLAIAGMLIAPLTIWAQTLRMQRLPEHLRGRSFGLIRTAIQSAPPLGAAAAGLLLPRLGVQPVIATVVLVIAVPGVVGLLHPGLEEQEAVGVEAVA